MGFPKFRELVKKGISKFGGGQKITQNDQLLMHMMEGCSQHVTPSQAYNLYDQSGPLGDAIDTIAIKFADIKPIIQEERDDVFEEVDVPEATELLKNPNKIESYNQFALNMGVNYLLNQNVYIEAHGNINFKPSSIYNIPNDQVMISEQINKALYQVTTEGFLFLLKGNFILDHELGRIIENSDLKEIFHASGFTNSWGVRGVQSKSKLSSIVRDIDVVNSSLVQLNAIHKKGFSAGILINVDSDDESAVQQFRTDAATQFSGSANSGKALVVRGKTINMTKIDQNNREMQTVESRVLSNAAIYGRFDIPQPLVDASAQTYNNYQTALYSLYDNAVLPLANTLFGNLTKMMQLRGVLAENQFITFDEKRIPALQLRRNEELSLLAGVNILKTDELRSLAGYDSTPGGDKILVPATLVPIDEDPFEKANLVDSEKTFMKTLDELGIKKEDQDAYCREYKSIVATKQAG